MADDCALYPDYILALLDCVCVVADHWEPPKFTCPYSQASYHSSEGRARERHVSGHDKRLLWECPYCDFTVPSGRFDDLRHHRSKRHQDRQLKDATLLPRQLKDATLQANSKA